MPLMNLRVSRPDVLVDLNGCAGLAYIETRGDRIAYGAMTRQIDAERSPLTQKYCPLVAQALAHAGPIAVRNRATVGGTLSHADRSAELPGVAIALDAIFAIDGINGRREVHADDFFIGDLTTDIAAGEMLVEVLFPVMQTQTFTAFFEVGNRQRDIAVAGVAVSIVFDQPGICRQARLASIGVDSKPARLLQAEQTLEGRRIDAGTIADGARCASEAIDPLDDVHATADYRREAVGALVVRALEAAVRFSGDRRGR